MKNNWINVQCLLNGHNKVSLLGPLFATSIFGLKPLSNVHHHHTRCWAHFSVLLEWAVLKYFKPIVWACCSRKETSTLNHVPLLDQGTHKLEKWVFFALCIANTFPHLQRTSQFHSHQANCELKRSEGIGNKRSAWGCRLSCPWVWFKSYAG